MKTKKFQTEKEKIVFKMKKKLADEIFSEMI